MSWLNLISFVGLFVLAGLAWACSNNRKVVNCRLLAWGLGMQLAIGLFVFVFPPGRALFLLINDATVSLLGHSRAGAEFVFGSLAIPPGEEGSLGFILAFQALTTAIFFATIVGLLHHFRILPWLILLFSRVFTKLMRVSGAEALCASSNVFVGIESALTIQPYLKRMTRSELCVVLTAGMATIASTVLGLYALLLQPVFPAIAGHLVSASLLSAPAALVAAKFVFPETEKPETLGLDVKPHAEKCSNWIEAVTTSAMSGLQLAFGIGVLLIATISLLSLCNSLLGWTGALVGFPGLSLEGLLGHAFHPLALLMGISAQDAGFAADLLGLRLVATEIPAYQQLAEAIGDGRLGSRSAVIIAYALCGFAHLPSLGIFIGGITAIERSTTEGLAKVAMRALLAATIACLMTGAVAGIFYTGSQEILVNAPAP